MSLIEYPWGAGDTLTRVLEAGDSGLPAVLVHGVGARADRWRENLEPLAAAGLHVFAVDLPGHGFAVKGDGFDEYSVPRYADFLQQFLDSIGATRAALIGTSLGGHVAATVACAAPERVSALVMVGTLGIVPIGAAAREALAKSIADVTEDGIRAKLGKVIHDPSLVTEAWVRTEARINSSPGAAASFKALGAYFCDRLDDDLVGERLAELAVLPPTLLVWGAEDVIVPPSIGDRARLILDRAEVSSHTIEAAGHAPYLERPELFNTAVLSFLRSSTVLAES